MSTAIATKEELNDESLLALVTSGDCKRLNPQQKIAYYRARCEAAGLDPRTAPFQFLTLQGREILYALKGATDQLAAKHGIRCEILDQRTENDIRVVTVRATTKDGRQTDEIGAVNVKGAQGEALCNALMKACTKAKRRAVLAVCGLGMLDETELDTIPSAQPQPVIQMPRRLSEREKQEIVRDVDPMGDVPLREVAIAEAQGELNDDTLALLERSVAEVNAAYESGCITQKQLVEMMQTAREKGKFTEKQVKEWLKSLGYASRKDIPVREYAGICERLADPTPLGA